MSLWLKLRKLLAFGRPLTPRLRPFSRRELAEIERTLESSGPSDANGRTKLK